MNAFAKVLLFAALALLPTLSLAADSTAHKKSLWESFTGFFSSKPEPKGEGDLYRQLAELENEIQDTQWRYTRETRAVRKNNYRLHLIALRASRDSLETLIEKGTSSSEQSISSEQKLSSSESPKLISSSSAASSSAVACEARTDSVFVTTTITKFVHDTLFIHDTLWVRDTIYIRDAAADSSAGENP